MYKSSKRLSSYFDGQISLETMLEGPVIGHGMLLPDYLFKALKNRAITVTENQIDKDVRELVKNINKIDGLATVWSCSGHDVVWYKKILGIENRDRGYIFIVGQQSKLNNVSRFINYMINKTWDEGLPIVGVILSSLHHPPLEEWDHINRYPGFTLEWSFNNERERKKNLDLIANVIKKFN